MLMIASRRSRNRSFLPDDGREGSIAKTPEIDGIRIGFPHSPILQTRWESLKRKGSTSFSGPTSPTAADCAGDAVGDAASSS